MENALTQRLEDHMTHDETSFSTIARALEKLSENATAMLAMGAEIKEVKTDVAWLKRFFWIVMTPLAGALVVAIVALIIKK